MKILITGICGFVGHALATRIKSAKSAVDIFGLDNWVRAGSEATGVSDGMEFGSSTGIAARNFGEGKSPGHLDFILSESPATPKKTRTG